MLGLEEGTLTWISSSNGEADADAGSSFVLLVLSSSDAGKERDRKKSEWKGRVHIISTVGDY